MIKILFGLILLCQQATYAQKKSGIPEIDTLPIHDWKIDSEPLSYVKTVGLSLLIPGAGQVYAGHYVRAGFMFTIEGLLLQDALIGKTTVFKQKNEQIEGYLQNHYNGLSGLSDPSLDTSGNSAYSYILDARQAMDVKMFHLDLRKSEIAWALGMHFYNVMDAVEIVANSRRTEAKALSGTKAFWYGVAFPGGAQLYTGRYGKFGMLWMAIGSSIASSIYRQEMVDYFQKRLTFARAEEGSSEVSELTEQTTLYRKRRNQYYWGIAVLYMYAIGDGMVDAILNDFNKKERYAVVPGGEPMSLALQVRF